MTVEQYFATEIDADWAQLIDGEIVVSNPNVPHGAIEGRIVTALVMWTDGDAGRGLAIGTTDVIIDDYNSYGPDVIWIAESHLPSGDRLERIPDLCVEVRSPSTWRYDLGTKRRGYERAGLPELWLVDYKELRVLVLRRSRPDSPTFDVERELHMGDELTSPQLPGFSLPLEDLFRR